MPAYLVELPDSHAGPKENGHDKVVVFAEDVAAAKSMAAASFPNLGTVAEAAWEAVGTTATEIAAATDLLGFTLRIKVYGAAAQTAEIEDTYVGVASDDVDLMGAGIVTPLNANADIANAAYNATTNVLTVAGAGDGLGDGTVEATMELNGVSIAGFIGTITDGGTAGAALTVALAADVFALPAIYASLRD